MKKLFNYLRGVVRIRAEGPFPERLLNLCAQERLDFWRVEWTEPTVLRFTTRRACVKKLKELAPRAGCTVQAEQSRGLPDFLLKFRSRYGFLAGLTLCLLAVGVLSRFVLTIEVTGNTEVPTAVILNELRLRGVRVGVWGPALDRKQLAQEVVLALPKLSWAAINRSGTRLEVSVREVKAPRTPIDESKYCDIVSRTDGLVTHVQAELGDAVVRAGDTVIAGDLLISGIVTMEPPQYTDLPPRYYRTHARGRVYARTWRSLTAVLPMKTEVKEYTGAERTVWSLEMPGRRIEIFGNSSISWPFCDKISKVWDAGLPVLLRREVLREYVPQQRELQLAPAQEMLERELRRRVEVLIGADGTLERIDFTAWVEDGLLKVTAEARSLEEIGREVPGSGVIPELKHSP